MNSLVLNRNKMLHVLLCLPFNFVENQVGWCYDDLSFMIRLQNVIVCKKCIMDFLLL